MPEVIHCGICNKPIRVKNFADQMKKIRKHRKEHHPRAFKASIKKGVVTRKAKGQWGLSKGFQFSRGGTFIEGGGHLNKKGDVRYKRSDTSLESRMKGGVWKESKEQAKVRRKVEQKRPVSHQVRVSGGGTGKWPYEEDTHLHMF